MKIDILTEAQDEGDALKLFTKRVKDAGLKLSLARQAAIFYKLRGYDDSQILGKIQKQFNPEAKIEDVQAVNTNVVKNIDLSGITSSSEEDKGEEEPQSLIKKLSVREIREYTDNLTEPQLQVLISLIENRIKNRAGERALKLTDKLKDKEYAKKHRQKIKANIR